MWAVESNPPVLCHSRKNVDKNPFILITPVTDRRNIAQMSLMKFLLLYNRIWDVLGIVGVLGIVFGGFLLLFVVADCFICHENW